MEKIDHCNWCSYKKKGGGNLGMNVQTGRLPYECRGRAWDDVTIAKDHQRLPESHQNLEERPGSDTSVASLGRRLFQTRLTQTLRTMTVHLCVQVVCGSLCYHISHCGQGERRRGRGNEER